ncbi:TerD domain-containing protein [Butyrivibrio fibrisolvens]|uniref:TerD domain-containing protein n=1 Tax=Butyrivibrio fibrisolvens TaxID=831 RepID=A0A1H9RQB9_BUTFI|nr:TerD family protein [Butyrivibrio fibrisolvens]SER75000.1 TerD domain-containing protein [Butyrivibrio fibrisolvens]
MKKTIGKDITIDGNTPISISFSWNRYDKQHSSGLIGGLLGKTDSAVDCDASAFLLEENNGTRKVKYCVGYDNLRSEEGAIVHGGDNINCTSLNNDEVISVDLAKVSQNIKAIVFTLDMLKEVKTHLAFGQLGHTKISITNSKTRDTIVDFNVVGIGDKAIQVGVLIRKNDGWMFKPEVVDFKKIRNRQDLETSINLEF